MWRAAVLIFGIACAGIADAQERLPHAIPVAPDSAGRVIAQVHVNEQGPYSFIVDTAASRGALSQRLATQLNLPTQAPRDVQTLSGIIHAPFVRIEHLASGAVDMRGVLWPVIGDAVLGGADGILGVEALARRRLMFDFDQRVVEISEADTPMPAGDWTTVRAQLRSGNLLVVRARVGGVPTFVIFDTGAARTIANNAFRSRYQQDLIREQRGGGVRVVGAGNARMLSDMMLLDRVVIGAVTVENVTVAVGDLDIFSAWGLRNQATLLLGMDVLRQSHAMLIDFRRATIHFRGLPDAAEAPNPP